MGNVFDFIGGLFTNIPLLSAFIATVLAQIAKILINLVVYKKWDWYLLVSTGGMPSSHTACVGALWMTLAILYGPGSVASAVSFILAAIVYRDAVGVRRQAGLHASILNTLLNSDSNDENNQPLKILLGHTPLQAISGLIIGILTGIIIPAL